jgi:predicted acylesterase/phospholipase RssA
MNDELKNECSQIQKKENENKEENKIKHIVISGGGTFFCTAYGVLKESNLRGFWKIEDIQSIYGTSAGALTALLLSLKIDWELLDNFLINRPWHKVFNIDIDSLFHSFTECGILNKKVIENAYEPLFKSVDIPLDITMKDYYDYNGIELHLFTTELETFSSIDISYKTHPEWKLLDAIYASCCLPILFCPMVHNNKIYLDGGFMNNYPLKNCCMNSQNYDEIFGIYNNMKNSETKIMNNIYNGTLIDYIINILFNIVTIVSSMNSSNKKIKNELSITNKCISIYDIYLVTSNKEERAKLIEYGSQCFKEYMNQVSFSI